MTNYIISICDLCAYENNDSRGIYCNYFKEKLIFPNPPPTNYDTGRPQDCCVGFVMLRKMKKGFEEHFQISYGGRISDSEL